MNNNHIDSAEMIDHLEKLLSTIKNACRVAKRIEQGLKIAKRDKKYLPVARRVIVIWNKMRQPEKRKNSVFIKSP